MELERRTQVETSEEPHAHEHTMHVHEDAADEVSFTGATHGQVPAVAGDEVAPPQPSASERAFGPSPSGVGAGEGVLDQKVTRVVHGVTIVAPAGTRTSAIDRVASIVRLQLGKNQYAQQKMGESRTTIVIIPARTRMTDVEQFTTLRGQKTFDGRDWSTVRGSGGLNAADGSFAIGVAEENLVNVRGVKSTYPTGYSIGMHELAHAFEAKALTPEQKARLDQLYAQQQQQDAKKPGTHHDAFTDNYAAENKREYFAQSTNAFFGVNVGREKINGKMVANHNSRLWLYKNDPDMHAFLVELYETNRGADGNRAS